MLVGQIGDIADVAFGRLRELLRGGIAVDEFEDPTGGNVLEEESQLGKGKCEQMM